MEVDQALNQISQIHEHLARTEVSRAFRAIPAAVAGMIALAAPILQPGSTPLGRPTKAFVIYWVGVAIVCGLITGGGLLRQSLAGRNRTDRRHCQTVLGQFIPSLTAGAALTAILSQEPLAIGLLPGLWAIIFSLGVFAARPFLPRAIGYVALFYFVVGTLMLLWALSGGNPARWGVGLTFGIGHLLTAFVLYWHLERKTTLG
jgi:hypothetical protein